MERRGRRLEIGPGTVPIRLMRWEKAGRRRIRLGENGQVEFHSAERRRSMKDEFIRQYGHFWRVFARIVETFDAHSWVHAGRKAYSPARLAFHLVHSTSYYLKETSPMVFASGKPFDSEWTTLAAADLPSQAEILACIREWQAKTERWLTEMDFAAPNTAFDWAGKTRLGVVIFLLRHSLYHLGEMSCLLNESKNGEVEDIYVSV
jgi:hypothetical protein